MVQLGLVRVGRGEIEITTYRRTDGGHVAGKATLEAKERTRLTPGVVRAYLPVESLFLARTADT